MSLEIERRICQATGAQRCELGEVIQQLWSGYGVIQKVNLITDVNKSAVVKHVDLSESRANRRGWDSDVAHRRKVKSYEVEQTFYQNFSSRCSNASRVPRLLGVLQLDDHQGWVIVLEDLDAAGFAVRKNCVSTTDVKDCLTWLATFHAQFMNSSAEGLWGVGTYWHLATRPDELAVMEDGKLKRAAKKIDQMLNNCVFQTLVHGDAKLANFCFSSEADRVGNEAEATHRVAAVDFQYVGRGCGMKDVAYLLTSCLSDDQCEQQYKSLLDFYFQVLRNTLGRDFTEFDALESEWRSMFAVAWADFNRFLNGWSPGHWKLTPFSGRMTKEALKKLEGGR